MSVRGSDDKNKRTVDGLVKTRQTSPTNFRLVKPARPAASSASTPVRKITIKSSRFAFLKTSKIKIGLVFLLLLAMVGGWFGYQRSNSGRVLGVAEEVRIDIPQFYTETLTVSKGNNILTVTPLEGKRVPVERYNNQYIYYTAYPYTDVIQTEYRYKIKEEMYFHQPGHPLEFKYRLGNIEAYLVEKDDKGNTFFYDKVLYQAGSERDLALNYTIPAPFVEDSSRKRDFSAVEVYVQDGLLVVKVDPVWLAQAKYPVILDPTIEINILNIYSHPQQGDDWLVDFVTQGTADLYIIPDDQATIDDDEFVSLSCAGLIRQPQILPGDIIYYPNWHCAGTGRVTHHTLKAGKHTLRFEFGDQVAYAYNDAGDSWWDTDWDYRLPIIIDNRNNTNTLTDFQVYVNVTSTVTDFWSNASNTGNDIRFTNKAGSLELPYYVTYYSTTTDEAIYWVKADSLSASVISTIYRVKFEIPNQ